MNPAHDVVTALVPPLRPGERVSLRHDDGDGRTEVIGFVTSLDEDRVGVVDRHGHEHDLARGSLDAIRRVEVARGRRPESTPRDLLDALAARAGVHGVCWVARITTVLEGLTPPAQVPAWGEWADLDGVRARFEGEWVTLAAPTSAADIVAAAWWATRMGARSVQVRVADGERAQEESLGALGFVRLG